MRSQERKRGNGRRDVELSGDGWPWSTELPISCQLSSSASWWHNLWGGLEGNPCVRACPRPDGRSVKGENRVMPGWRPHSPCSIWRGADTDGWEAYTCGEPHTHQQISVSRPPSGQLSWNVALCSLRTKFEGEFLSEKLFTWPISSFRSQL